MRNASARVKWGLLIAVLCTACNPVRGCAESDFDGSRLPRWFTLANGQSRSDVIVLMTYYIGPGGGRANFVLRDRNDRKLAEVEGPVRDIQPQTLTPPPPSGPLPYPVYEVASDRLVSVLLQHHP